MKKILEQVKKKSPLSLMRLLVIKHNLESLLHFSYENFDGFLKNPTAVLSDHYWVKEYRMSNDFYGIATTLKKYCNRKKPLHAFIEHGVYFGDYVNMEEVGDCMPAIITFSETRKKHIRKVSEIPVLCIGPYINYVESYFNHIEMKQLKEKYGKILLAFPQHTISGVGYESDDDVFIDKIKEVKNSGKFDTVFVSLYYRQATDDAIKFYKSNGFVPVCAGNRSDPQFLSRLRSFIELSDLTISDNVGTHIGYCEALSKEHVLFGATGKLVAKNEKAQELVPELVYDEARKEKADVRSAYEGELNEEKKQNVLKRYWGQEKYFSKDELKHVFDFLDRVYYESKRGKKPFKDVYTELMEKEGERIRHILEEAVL